jgi:secreted PhoX family phosphatase
MDTRYDTLAGAGVVVIDVDLASRRVVNSFVGINGTWVNCAGGKAFKDTGWITCEETTAGPADGWNKKHGYAFFLPVDAETTVPAVPLPAMGRFAHEAVAVGRRWGTVYETEDAGSGRGSGLYRFTPTDRNDLTRGGRLQMLAIEGHPQADLREGQTPGRALPVVWVDIDHPDPDPVIQAEEEGANSCFAQGWAGGGAKFNRLEGIWLAPPGYGYYFASTSGGDVKSGDVNDDGFEEGFGQIWRYRPRNSAGGTLFLEFESPGGSVLDSPDNLTVSPRGGLVLCEDDSSSSDGDTHPLAPGIADVNRLIGLTADGDAFEFAVNAFSGAELAGACYSPDGSTLFVNIFGDETGGTALTCAIRGPWGRGAL